MPTKPRNVARMNVVTVGNASGTAATAREVATQLMARNAAVGAVFGTVAQGAFALGLAGNSVSP